MTDYFDRLETRSQPDRDQALLTALQGQIDHARQNAAAYTDLLAEFDGRSMSALSELAALPVTRKADLQQWQSARPPFGGLLAAERIKYIFSSPGPIYEPAGYRADYWRFARALFAAGFRRSDLVHNSFSYHLTPAGQMVDSGCHALGCTVIPAGVGQTELQLQTIRELKPNGYAGTPSFLKILVQQAQQTNTDIAGLHKALVSGEALPASTRRFLFEHGVAAKQCYATADLGLIAYESIDDQGLIVDEGVLLEIVRPGTGIPLPAGEVGEVVVTTLNPDYPLIRFATGDLSALLPGTSECGRTNMRIQGWMGRADQTAKVRGLFVHPSQVAQIVQRYAQIEKARLIIRWVEQRDSMCLHCECRQQQEASLTESVQQSIRDICKLRAEVKWVAPGSLPNDGVVIEDAREYD